MSGGSMEIRSESLEKQLQNGVLPIQVPSATKTTKSSKTFKENETLVHWICKFAGHQKVGMLLFFAISTAGFVWVLYIGKDEDRTNYNVPNVNHRLPLNNSGSPQNLTPFPVDTEESDVKVMPPPSPSYFLGYSLPPGHPCNSFSLPPPPADRKRTGPRACPVCYLPVEEAVALMPKLPSFSPVLKNLTYIYEENPNQDTEFGGSDFGGYPTLKQRNDSYDVRESMNIHCGFVKGSRPGHGTGFDIDDNDLLEMEKCHGVVVVSAIFGAFDIINQPIHISEYSKQTVCFYMFVDQQTKDSLYGGKKTGLWRIVVVHNLPYAEGRRNGKIPKLLPHRLFPNARYSLWIDGKLQLLVDPYQILERFLWRKNATFAISRHYKRFDVFVEVEANKAAHKYDNASLDFQVEFYKNEGLTPYSEAKLPITSDVPEGCVIIREHVPISNLFTCLWFNEVDRFTPRDQISFSTVRDRITANTNWTVNMFWDCERRNFVFQQYHKDILDLRAQMAPPAISPPPPPQSLANNPPRILFSLESPDVSPRHGRYRRSGSKHYFKVGNEIDSI